MPRKIFYSFEYKPDNWRASKIRNIGAIEENKPATDNDWETIQRGGDPAIERWINSQLSGRTCTIVLIGATTAGRKWINYEIKKSWESGMGILGIHIHNITDRYERQCTMGANPFSTFNIGTTPMPSIVKTYTPPYAISKDARNYIANNLESWIEEAIRIRNNYK